MVTRTSPAPKRPRVDGTSASGTVPVVITCASDESIANAAASTKQRVAMRIATAPLDRTPQLLRMQHVQHHAARAKVGRRGVDQWIHAHGKDAMMRAPKREHRRRQSGPDLRCDDDERRAPRKASALREEHRLGRVRGIWPEAREDLQAAEQRARAAPQRRSRALMRQIVEAVRHEPDLPAGVRGLPHELGGGGDDYLDRLRVGLDPVLIVRGHVDQEHRVEARRGFVELGLKLAHTRARLPVDLLSRIAAAMLAYAAKAQRIREKTALRRGFREGAQRRQVPVAHRGRYRVRDHGARDRDRASEVNPSQSPPRRRSGPTAYAPRWTATSGNRRTERS